MTDQKKLVYDLMTPFSMTFNDPYNPRFKITPFFGAENLRNRKRYTGA